MKKEQFIIKDTINTKEGIQVGLLTGSLIGENSLNMVYIVRKKRRAI